MDLTSMTLLEGVKVQDAESWRRLVALYTPLLRHWCRRWGVIGEDADDVLQEVYQAVALGLKDFRRDREGDSFRGWLRGVTRNKVLLYFRRRGTPGMGGTDFYHRSLTIPDHGPEPVLDEEEGEIVGELYRNALRIARSEFEDRTWQAFWRSAVEGQPSTDIADDLGITPAAVRQAKSRVLRRLKTILGNPRPTQAQ